MKREKVLHLQNVRKSFAGRTVVNVKDVTFGNYGIESLIGPNGAGKSTLINLITHKISADQGKFLYYCDGREFDISKKRLDQIARMGLVKTNQLIQDFESLTIVDSMLLALASSKYEKFYNIFTEKKLRERTKDEIERYLDYFHFDDPTGHALSAGEKKLLDIIRCMLIKPRFLLMDEPTAGLPHDQTEKVIELMHKKSTEEGMAILIVEHDLDLIWRVSENIFFMAEGEINLSGTADEIRRNETVINKYVGGNNA